MKCFGKIANDFLDSRVLILSLTLFKLENHSDYMTENSKITSIQNIPFIYNRKIRDIRMLLRVILGGRVQIPAKTTLKKVAQMAETRNL